MSWLRKKALIPATPPPVPAYIQHAPNQSTDATQQLMELATLQMQLHNLMQSGQQHYPQYYKILNQWIALRNKLGITE
jgi:hypothetical protein